MQQQLPQAEAQAQQAQRAAALTKTPGYGYLPAVTAPYSAWGAAQPAAVGYMPPRTAANPSFFSGGGGGGGGSGAVYATPDAAGWGTGNNHAPASGPGQNSSASNVTSQSGPGGTPGYPSTNWTGQDEGPGYIPSAAPSAAQSTDVQGNPISGDAPYGRVAQDSTPELAPSSMQNPDGTLANPNTIPGNPIDPSLPYQSDPNQYGPFFAQGDPTATPGGLPPSAAPPAEAGMSAGPAGALSGGWDADLNGAPPFPPSAQSAGPMGVLPAADNPSLNDFANANPKMLMSQLDSIYGDQSSGAPQADSLNNLAAANPGMTLHQINQLADQQAQGDGMGPIASMPGTSGSSGMAGNGGPGEEGASFTPSNDPTTNMIQQFYNSSVPEAASGYDTGWGGNDVFGGDMGQYGEGQYTPEQYGPAGGLEAGNIEGIMGGGGESGVYGPAGGEAGSAGDTGGGAVGDTGGGDYGGGDGGGE